jgi:RimJ/RimL family protein N-acetyltransferase
MDGRIGNSMLRIVPRTRDEVEATLEAMNASVRAQISADWLAKFHASARLDPWVHGFHLLLDDGTNVGIGSFKGPPADDMVEIAYAVVPEHQGRGHATAAARAMVGYAFESGSVRVVRAHTLPDGAASQRVLLKCGFMRVGEYVDPDDGPVVRFEISRNP